MLFLVLRVGEMEFTFNKIKQRKLFWVSIILICALNLILCPYVYSEYSINSRLSAEFSFYENRNESAYGGFETHFYQVSTKIRYESEDGPFAATRDIIPYEIEFERLDLHPPFECNYSYLILEYRMFIPDLVEGFDSEQVVSITLNNTHKYPTIYQHHNVSFNLSKENGTFYLPRSGTAYVTCQVKAMMKGFNENETRYFEWFGEVMEKNALDIEPILEYHKYKQMRFSVVTVLFVAITFSIPATFKTLSTLYWEKNENTNEPIRKISYKDRTRKRRK